MRHAIFAWLASLAVGCVAELTPAGNGEPLPADGEGRDGDDPCGDGLCAGGETCSSCPDDCLCPAGAICAEDVCVQTCGNGVCDEGESGELCDVDCRGPCGNGVCDDGETIDSCPADCPKRCGNGDCEESEGEDSDSCPEDCPRDCGNGVCGDGELHATCPEDCPIRCGDLVCEPPETHAACPADCAAQCLAEVCNYSDDDCDGLVDEGVSNACGGCGSVPSETCNYSDDDCDGEVDEGVANACGGCGEVPQDVCWDWTDNDCNDFIDDFCDFDGDGSWDAYECDADNDGYLRAGYGCAGDDCQDLNAGCHPGAPDPVDGWDWDCDGLEE